MELKSKEPFDCSLLSAHCYFSLFIAFSPRFALNLRSSFVSCFFKKPVFSFEFEISAEVKFFNLVVIGKFFSRSVFEDFSFDQQIGTVANGKGFSYIMISDQYSDVAEFKFGNY